MDYQINYDINLPADLETIVSQDFYIMDNVTVDMFKALCDPVKFEVTTWIVIKKGSCRGEINLLSHTINAPSIATFNPQNMLLVEQVSDDFEATVICMSKRFIDNLFVFFSDTTLYTKYNRQPVLEIPPILMPKVMEYVEDCNEIVADTGNPYAYRALVFETAAFIFKTLSKCYDRDRQQSCSSCSRITSRFLALLQEHFKTSRQLDFYAEKLCITPKHLSRSVKQQTGYTAIEWIERFVVLEAKIMLKSTDLNVQQIADALNFATQSFFGKYFKKVTGLTPKQFRNS